MKEYLYINAHKTVQIEYADKTKKSVQKVFISGSEYIFDEQDKPNLNKMDYAQKTKREMYTRFLNNQFENLIFLSGAGTSIGFGEADRKGKAMANLWDDAVDILGDKDFIDLLKAIKYDTRLKDIDSNKIPSSLILKGDKCVLNRNLEAVLSLATPAIPYINTKIVDIELCVDKIKDMIREACDLTFDSTQAPHLQLLNKLTKRRVTLPRFKLFTLNYDLMFEQAASEGNFVVIDGFSYTFPRIFSGRNFDYDIVNRHKSRVKEEDNFIERVFHLYKPHGSLNWEKKGNHIIQSEKNDNPLMIYPHSNKYESSYDQPYFEMMSRFQNNLRLDNTLLITIGFSYGDKHIVTAIKEAVEQNPSFQLLIVSRSIDEENAIMRPFIELAKQYSNIHILAESFADFSKYYPDLKSYNHDESQRLTIKLPFQDEK